MKSSELLRMLKKDGWLSLITEDNFSVRKGAQRALIDCAQLCTTNILKLPVSQ